MRQDFEHENSKLERILVSFTNMKYVFAGSWLEYRRFIAKQEENGYMEISQLEQLNRIVKGGTLIVTGSYKKRAIWPEIEAAAKERGIIIEEQLI